VRVIGNTFEEVQYEMQLAKPSSDTVTLLDHDRKVDFGNRNAILKDELGKAA
jgi:hypothetical protein